MRRSLAKRLSWLASGLAATLLLSACLPFADSRNGASGTAQEAMTFETRSFASTVLAEEVRYHVLLPPSYREAGDTYPVVYWLHGSAGYPPGILDMLAARFHHAMQDASMPPAVIVFPDGFAHSLWSNRADGTWPVEEMFVREFVPHIDATLRTRTGWSGRMIEGASMGGYGAARLGLRYPHVFGAVSMINPGPMQPVLDPDNVPSAGRERAQQTLDTVFGGDGELFTRQSPWRLAEEYAERACPRLRIRMVLGEDDPITPNNMRFSRHLQDLGITHEVRLISNAGHDPGAMLAGLGDDYWAFFARALEERQRAGC